MHVNTYKSVFSFLKLLLFSCQNLSRWSDDEYAEFYWDFHLNGIF